MAVIDNNHLCKCVCSQYTHTHTHTHTHTPVVAVSTVSSVAVIGLAIVSIVLGVVCCERKRASTYRRLRMAVDVSKDTV